MKLIKEIIQGEGRLGKVFDYTIQIFIFLSLALLSIETLPNLTVKQREILNLEYRRFLKNSSLFLVF